MPESNAEKTLVTIATYNEMENLPKLVAAIFEHAAEVDLLVVDDNSPDGTGDWCDEQAKTDPRVKCLHREGKLGLGTATIAAMQYAMQHGYKQMLNMDADFSHPPERLPAMLQRMREDEDDDSKRVDVVIGSRYIPGGGIEGWPIKRRFMSWGVNLYARTLLWLAPKDCSGAYRCYRTSLLEKIDFDAVLSRGYSFQEEILWHMRKAGARMAEVPITFVDRQFGESKINMNEAYSAVWILFKLGIRNWLGMGPRRA